MNANLGPVFEQFLSELVASGLYQSQSEVIREGLRLLKEREELKKLRKEIALGSAQADRGEFVEGPKAFREIRRPRPARRKRWRASSSLPLPDGPGRAGTSTH